MKEGRQSGANLKPPHAAVVSEMAHCLCDAAWTSAVGHEQTTRPRQGRVLDLDRFQLRIIDQEVLALGDLVAAPFVFRGDRLAGFFIDELLAQAIAGGLVDLMECDALRGRARRMQRNWTGDQRKLEVAFPVGTHNQLLLLRVYACDAVARGQRCIVRSGRGLGVIAAYPRTLLIMAARRWC